MDGRERGVLALSLDPLTDALDGGVRGKKEETAAKAFFPVIQLDHPPLAISV